MLQSLDVLIGLAVILSMVSLLITIGVQLITDLLALRGKNLANSLAMTLRTIDPEVGGHAEAVVQHILSHPVLSGSVLNPKALPKTAQETGELALAHEMAAAEEARKSALNLIEQAQAEFDQVGRAFQESSASSGGAPSIAAVAQLRMAYRRAVDSHQEAKRMARSSIVEAAVSRAKGEAAAGAQGGLDAARQAATAACAQAGEAVAAANRALTSAKCLPPEMMACRQAGIKLQAAQLAAREHIVRAATARARLSTVAGGASRGTPWPVWQLGHLRLADAVRADEVYRMLNGIAALNPSASMRQGLPPLTPWKIGNLLSKIGVHDEIQAERGQKVAATMRLAQGSEGEVGSGEVLLQAGKLGEAIESATAQPFDHFQKWFDSAVDRTQQWFQMQSRIVTIILSIVATFVLQLDLLEIYQQVSTDKTLRDALVKQSEPYLKSAESSLAAVKAPPEAAWTDFKAKHPEVALTIPAEKTCAAFSGAIQSAGGQEKGPALAAEYQALCDADAKAAVQADADHLKATLEKMGGTGYPFIPKGRRWSGQDGWWQHFPGMLCMAGLLSLGAPFWFSLLKNLTNLRPTIAQLVDAQPLQTPPSTSKK